MSETPSNPSGKQKFPIIDCDVHQAVPLGEVRKYMAPGWERVNPPSGISWPSVEGHAGLRRDAIPPEGGSPGSSPSYMVEHLIEPYNMEYVILTGGPNMFANLHPNAGFAVAYMQAYNDWQKEKWLSFDERFLGSMVVAPQDIQASVKEIERVGSDPQIVQILMPSASPLLYGKPYFWPLYEAAAAHGLPVAIHPGAEGAGTSVTTAAGHPSYYIEWHTMLCTSYINHVVSLICEGVFEQFPNFRYVLIEGGIGWAAPVMWRLDKNWKALRAEVPWLKRLPSETLKECIRFTTQPIEEPDNVEKLLVLYEDLDARNTVMFSTDYPHWDFDEPHVALRGLPADMQERIFHQNARDLYFGGK